jgi:hypothetical protein
VPCAAPDTTPEAFQVRRITLPVATERSGREAPTAVVLRDLRIGKALRSVEDTLLQLRASTAGPHGVESRLSAMDHHHILRHLAHETHRSHRDGQELSLVLVKAPASVSREVFARAIVSQLRGNDRAGLLEAGVSPSAGDSSDATVTTVEMDIRAHSCVIVLPCTPRVGAEALIMRLRATLPQLGLHGLAFGPASLRLPVNDWGGAKPGLDRAQDVLRRAYETCVAELRERTPTAERAREQVLDGATVQGATVR